MKTIHYEFLPCEVTLVIDVAERMPITLNKEKAYFYLRPQWDRRFLNKIRAQLLFYIILESWLLPDDATGKD